MEADLLQEAIISSPRNVGPMLPKAVVPKVDWSGDSRVAQTVHATVTDTSSTVRSVIDSVMEKGSLPPATQRESDVGKTDAELRQFHRCTSLAVWQAHLRGEPSSIQSYNDFVEVRREYEEKEDKSRLYARLKLKPETDVYFAERIIGDSNLEQINFLARGQRAARTVGRVSVISEYGIPAGTGSGFLVGPGLLLTNNHVVSSMKHASSGSYVLFDYEYDADNRLRSAERFELTDELFITDVRLDFTLVSVAKTGSKGTNIEDMGRMRLVRESGKALKGEAVSIIQHPGGLPKQIAFRDSTVVGRRGDFVYYYTDTNPGSSGAPVVNDQWFPVALHHRSVPNYYKTCDYVANRGVRISSICRQLEQTADIGNAMAAKILDRLEQEPQPGSTSGHTTSVSSSISSDTTLFEKFKEPYHELPYDDRQGYDDEFLGPRLGMPSVPDIGSIAAPRIDTCEENFVLDYEHFSIVMHKERRLAIFCAANVDTSEARKRPEPDREYGRKALNGFGKNDREKWFIDPRIAFDHQLPDQFFEKDDKAFDKGHLTMRSEVAWGFDYAQVRRANGDTFHTTNCSPQVADFNRSIFGFTGVWGQLEEFVLESAKVEKLCVFAGPVLADDDKSFQGRIGDQRVPIQIPSRYWKLIVARSGSGFESFAFVLEQDLSDVDLELTLTGQWVQRRISVSELESIIKLVKFPPEFH